MRNLQMQKCPAPVRQMRGVGAVRLLAWIPVALILLLVLVVGFYEGRKAYWDYRVREMCEKDGGVKVIEIIDVDASTYQSLKNKFGQIDIPVKEDPRSVGAVVFHSYKDIYLRHDDPEVRRSELVVTRASSGAIVATSITYSRVGGDILALHPSHFSCPSAPNDFFASVINLKEGKK